MKNRPPDYISGYGNQYWYDENHEYHNDDNGYFPAKISFWGSKFWYKHGKLHNENGPAIIWSDGHKEWYIDGVRYSEEKFKQYKIKNFIYNG